MKKITLSIFIVVLLLCSCSRKEDTDYLEFSKTKWGMSMDETLAAYGITEKDTTYYQEDSVFAIKDHELFGEKTSEIQFNFIDLKNGNPVLCAVRATYPESTDMNNILKKMQKAYGKTVSDISIYDLMRVLGDELPERKYTESEHLKLWTSKSVIQSIPENEHENYRDSWENYQLGLNDENWDMFSRNSKLVRVVWTDNGEFPAFEKNGVELNAYNLVVYNEIKSQLSDQ